ncbi:MAG TPA: hypothetical protein VH590_10835, partial [Ktedonobacterales bacterium]
MKDAGNGSSEDGFEVEISAIEPGQEDEREATVQTALARGLSRKARARRLVLAVGALLVALLVFVSVPTLRNQALGLFGGAALPTPTPGGFSYSSLTSQPTPGPGWTLAGPQYASSIAFAPGAPETAYACGVEQATGSQLVPIRVGISRDYGHTWQMFSTPAVGVSCNLSVDPTNARDVLLIVSPDNQCASPAASKLYRALDGGEQWSRWSLPPQDSDQSPALLCAQWAWVGSTLYIAPILSIDP